MLKNNCKIKPIALVIALALGTSTAQAVDFNFGEDNDILLQINSQLDIGTSWRLEDPSTRLYNKVNRLGGEGSTTTDDGALNYDKGDTFSTIIKGMHDIQLSKGNFGAFVRFKYWYDYELTKGDVAHGNSVNGYTPNTPLSDDGFEDNSKFSGISLLDAYVYGSFDLDEVYIDIRLGRQVVSWGESTFIQGGMNSSNPFDVPALRRPGATLKEGILPVGMLYANVGLTKDLSIESFYQYEWEKTQVDGCGTYFSGADYAATGCNYVSVGVNDEFALANGFYADREADLEPDDGGQYGLAARYYSEALNDTEFGLYYMNIHSRFPVLNAIRSAVPPAFEQATGVPAQYAPVFLPELLDPTGGDLSAFNPGYNVEFPEDLKYYGISFATNVGGTALSGEISYKPDTPIQVNGPEVLNAGFTENEYLRMTPRTQAVSYGQEVKAWDAFDVTQMQITAIHFFENTLGASRVTFIGEVGLILTDDIEDSDQHYGRNSSYGIGDFSYTDQAGEVVTCREKIASGENTGDCRTDGFVTDSAWGYRMKAVFDYADAVAGISLKPSVYFAHDVSGYSPEPGQQFHEGRVTVGLSLEASYLQSYTATIGYNNYSGGSHNMLEDKDYISVNFGISY